MDDILQTPDPLFSIDLHFDDFDAFTETARDWDLDFQQLEAGKFNARLQQCGLENGQLGKAKFNRKLNQSGLTPAGLRTYVVPANPDLQLNWRRHQVSGNDLMIFPANGELASISNSCFEVFTISLADEWLEKQADSLESRQALTMLRSCEVVQLTSGAMSQIRNACAGILENLTARSEYLHSLDFTYQVREELPRLMIQALGQYIARKAPAPLARVRHQALKSAREAINCHGRDMITVSRLCEISGASERTLQYAFQEEFGISPKSYIQAHRLNHVRKELRSSDSESTVITDIANDWGFWHMGQFAADYRRMFGELPSATLLR